MFGGKTLNESSHCGMWDILSKYLTRGMSKVNLAYIVKTN